MFQSFAEGKMNEPGCWWWWRWPEQRQQCTPRILIISPGAQLQFRLAPAILLHPRLQGANIWPILKICLQFIKNDFELSADFSKLPLQLVSSLRTEDTPVVARNCTRKCSEFWRYDGRSRGKRSVLLQRWGGQYSTIHYNTVQYQYSVVQRFASGSFKQWDNFLAI